MLKNRNVRPMKPGRSRNPAAGLRSAFTLVEVVIAALALGVMGVTLYAAIGLGFQTVDANREELRATQIMMQKAETVRLCTWGQLTNFTFRENYDPRGTTNNTAGTLFTGTVVTNLPGNISDTASYKTNMRLVTVTIYWTNYVGARPVVHSRQMQTQVARYGLQNYIWGTVE